MLSHISNFLQFDHCMADIDAQSMNIFEEFD